MPTKEQEVLVPGAMVWLCDFCNYVHIEDRLEEVHQHVSMPLNMYHCVAMYSYTDGHLVPTGHVIHSTRRPVAPPWMPLGVSNALDRLKLLSEQPSLVK